MTAVRSESELPPTAQSKPAEPGGLLSRPGLRKVLPVAVVLAVGIALSFVSFNFVLSENRDRIRQRLQDVATDHTEVFRHSIALNLTALLSVRGLFDASSTVSRAEFEVFATPILKRLVGIQALEWIPRVQHEDRHDFETAAQGDGFTRFTFTEREAQGQMISAATRKEYYPVYFVEPVNKNRIALGFDLGSSAKRLSALNLARDTGNPVATAPITLVQESGSQRAFLVFVPIYHANAPLQGVEARRASIRGFSLGVYRVGDMIEATLEELGLSGESRFYIFDVSDGADKQPLYQSHADMTSGESTVTTEIIRSGLHAVRRLNVAGRTWEVVFKPVPGRTISPIDVTAISALLIGLLFTTLIAAYIWAAVHRTERVEQLVVEQTKTLRNTNQELEQSNEELRRFATVASHDLQEPLRSLQSFCGLLRSELGDELSENGRDFLSRINRSADRMETLIKDLLNYSRISTKGDAFVPVDLNDVARHIVADLETQISECEASVQIGDLPTIDADPLQMRQLLQNLIGNAIKYRREDARPTVTVEAMPVAGSVDGVPRDWFQMTVRDNGIGFEEEHTERIFGVFQRLHGRSAYEGTGIGLAICRKIVDRHGGRIEAQGVIGEGATFTMTLPKTNSARR